MRNNCKVVIVVFTSYSLVKQVITSPTWRSWLELGLEFSFALLLNCVWQFSTRVRIPTWPTSNARGQKRGGHDYELQLGEAVAANCRARTTTEKTVSKSSVLKYHIFQLTAESRALCIGTTTSINHYSRNCSGVSKARVSKACLATSKACLATSKACGSETLMISARLSNEYIIVLKQHNLHASSITQIF